MALILIEKANNLAEILISLFKPIWIAIGRKIDDVSPWNWNEAFLGPLITSMFLVLVLMVFFLISTGLVGNFSYGLKGIWLCFLFPSLRFFDYRFFYRNSLSDSLSTFYGLLIADNVLVYLPQYWEKHETGLNLSLDYLLY